MEGYDGGAPDDLVEKTTAIEVFAAMSGELYCKIEWPDNELFDSTDFVSDLTDRLPPVQAFGVRFLLGSEQLLLGQSWEQLGRPQQITMALQALTREFDQQLLLAAADGAIDQVRSVLSQFQDPNCEDEDGATPLLKASRKGHAEVVSLLLDGKADCHREDSTGQSPLVAAICSGLPQIVRSLLEARASGEESGSLQFPLRVAVLRSDMAVANTLIEFSAKLDKPILKGRTALTVAAHYGDIYLVESFLKARADINQRDEDGLIPLTIAARIMHVELIRKLLDAAADKDLTKDVSPRFFRLPADFCAET